MLVYFMVYFIIVMLSLGGKKQNKYKWVIFLFFSLFSGLSINGKDKVAYLAYFDSVPTLDNLSIKILKNSTYELGYFFLNSFVRYLTNDFRAFILLISIFGNLIYFKAAQYIKDKFCIDIWTMMIFYYPLCYFQLNFSFYRQYIAAMIFFYSIKYLVEAKKIKYIIFIFLASLFHKSAIILLVLIVIPYFKNMYKRIFFIIASSLIVYYFVEKRIDPIYKGTEYGIFGLLLCTLYLIIGILYFKKGNKKDSFPLSIFLYFFILYNIFNGKNSFMYRFSLYFYPIFQFLIPLCLKNIKFKKIGIYYIIFPIIGIAYIFIYTNEDKRTKYIPYETYTEKLLDESKKSEVYIKSFENYKSAMPK